MSMVPYDATRLAWFAGWPLGLSGAMYRNLQDPPELLVVGLGLGILSTAAAALTHAFVAPWGERFPRCVPRVAGREVPVMLAVAPATVVVTCLPATAVMLANPRLNRTFDWENWGTWLPSVFILVWAAGLGGAVWTYYLRRRTACRWCMTTVQASG